MTSGCTCERCVSNCKGTPGWFAPGEAEKAASLMGMPFDEFFKKNLVVDYWDGDKETNFQSVLVLSPAKEGFFAWTGRRAPFEFAFRPGSCIFLESDRCSIHACKPKECQDTNHNTVDTRERKIVRDLWNTKEHQDEIVELLRRNA